MEFTTTAGQLRHVLNTARLATPTNPSSITYSGNYFYVKDSILNVTGTDGETFFIAHCRVEDHKDGSFLINTKNLTKLISAIKSDDKVFISNEKSSEEITVKVDNKIYYFRTMLGNYPPTPFPSGESFEVDIENLSNVLGLVKKSSAKDNSIAEIKVEDNILQINTTDNYRLSHGELEGSNIKKINGVLPVSVLEKITKFDIRKITLDNDGRTILFSSPNVEIITRLLNNKFPDITNFLVNKPEKTIQVDRLKFLQSLLRLDSLVDNENTNLIVSILENEITLTIQNNDIGRGTENLELKSNKHIFEFIINFYYIKDAVESLNGDFFEFRIESEYKPIYILEANSKSIVHIISPIKK
jgi:DNA polymerase III sliding clamp (beta) subunit (PCNA family)